MAFGVYQPPFGAKKRGTGFTNLQTYLQANQSNRLGQAIGSGIQQTAQKAKQNIGTASNQFQQQAQQQRLDTDVNRQKIGNILGRFNPQAQATTQQQAPTQTQQTPPAQVTAQQPAIPAQQEAQPVTTTPGLQTQTEVQNASIAPIDDRAVAVQAAPTTPQVSEEEMKDFERFRSGAYTGPTSIQNLEALRGSAMEAEQLGQSVGSEGGRLGLLQRFAARPQQQYGLGQQRIDQLLMGGTTPQLRQARREAMGLTGLAERAGSGAEEMGQQLKNLATQFGQETLSKTQATRDPLSKTLEEQVLIANNAEKQRAQMMTDMKDILTGRGIQAIKDPITGEVIRKSEEFTDENEARKRALTMAAESGLLNVEELQKIGEMGRKLQTPIERMISQRVEGGAGGILGYGGAKPGETFSYAATPITSSLKLNQLLRDYLQGEEASDISRTGISSDEQKRQLNLLNKLGGQTEEFTGKGPAYKSGRLGFDLDKMGRVIDEDIARLRNEKLEAPTLYNEVPLSEKLRATFLPTADEMTEQQRADMERLTGADKGLDQRAGAYARMVYGTAPRFMAMPYARDISQMGKYGLAGLAGTNQMEQALDARRAATGIATETLRPVLDKVGLAHAVDQVNKIQDMISAPVVRAAEGFRKGVGGIIERIPIISNISNAIGGIFCYAEGTDIKMKDGSWKKIESIKVGDSVFLGGEVTGTGETKAEFLYHYKDQLVEGNHAVFEDGKFIRVENSKLGEKYKNTLDIRLIPLVTKNHLVVTRTHIGSDLVEVDNTREKSDKQKIEILNKDKNLLELLDKYDKMMFYGNKKD